MKKTGVLKETDLTSYLPHGNEPLSLDLFFRFKSTNNQELAELIKENILDQEPKQLSPNKTKKTTLPPNISTNLEQTLERAMEKVKAKKESDVCLYVPYGDGRLHHFTFQKLKKTEPIKLLNILDEHILSIKPKKYERKYKAKKAPSLVKDENSLEAVIDQALKRKSLKLKKETDICRYLPHGNVYMHPLAFRSLKTKDPEKLKEMVKEYVLIPKKPKILIWHRTKKPLHQDPQLQEESSLQNNPQTTRGEKTDQLLETMSQLLQALQNPKDPHTEDTRQDSHKSGQALIDEVERDNRKVFSESVQDRYLRTIQNQLIKRIREKQVDYELWDAFVELAEHV